MSGMPPSAANLSPGPVVGCILAGGLARRMGGGDKPLMDLGGRPMLAHVIDRLRPQVNHMLLNANGDPARFARFDLPVIADPVEGFAGPLAGVLAGLTHVRAHFPEAKGIVTVAGDTPFFPADLVARLLAERDPKAPTIVLAEASGKYHPVFGYWPVALTDPLERFLIEGTTRKVLAFVERHTNARADFTPPPGGRDPFFNINTPEDLHEAAATLAGSAS
ncbi:molybdenum cofactor guanylyltransferase MobA [Stappia indica]|uniref:molybdenum cofactor guanylyltransferase MobA n=1 Tax=Stappia indica TaxID=538381 RepID=UPI001CD38A12|nr:molybdenum cofactor guanylyltransferase MobA [Stappia indica]MCA1297289.1 molybdenum cofactor guanylyltransferase MobA [Stappia indica]